MVESPSLVTRKNEVEVRFVEALGLATDNILKQLRLLEALIIASHLETATSKRSICAF